jgi:transketolase
MSAICSGIALHGGFVPYCGTFLVFSDYSRNAVRMAALMKKKVVFVFTHDSIGLGEDGPTHQPVEHAASLRLIPSLHVWRPSDSVEVAIAWKRALTYEGPTALLLSRQKLPSFPKAKKTQKNIEKGGYILFDKKKPDIILIATGSEIKLAVEARNTLAKENHIAARVVSIPSTTVFDQQTESYKKSVLPNTIPKMVIEAGVTDYWWKYQPDVVLGIDQFGESAPAKDLFDSLNISVETIVESVLVLLEKQ